VTTVEIDDLDDPRLADFRNVPDPVLLRERGLFIAEGRLVVRQLLASPSFRTRSVLVSPPALTGMRDALENRAGLPVYVLPVSRLSALVGFNLHRGCLAVGERPSPTSLEALVEGARASRLLVVAERIANADNVGGIFRNALAFGAGGVLLGPNCCDPLYRKAIRVSIGGTLRVPFAQAAAWPADLEAVRAAGFTVVALTPGGGAGTLEAQLRAMPPGAAMAVLAGHEGEGLTEGAVHHADWCARIPMQPDVDSLNVSTATGIALHACRQHLGWPDGLAPE
jgi:tRNA G18 (ribose-2'-O)-methylase SpoU